MPDFEGFPDLTARSHPTDVQQRSFAFDLGVDHTCKVIWNKDGTRIYFFPIAAIVTDDVFQLQFEMNRDVLKVPVTRLGNGGKAST